eukprot:1161880-Pelagomonas_calceolata.AAC.3
MEDVLKSSSWGRLTSAATELLCHSVDVCLTRGSKFMYSIYSKAHKGLHYAGCEGGELLTESLRGYHSISIFSKMTVYNECSPVIIKSQLLGLYFEVLDCASGAKKVVSKGSAAKDVCKVRISDILAGYAAVFVTASSYMEPS